MAFAQGMQDVMIRVVSLLTILFLGVIAARTVRALIARAVIETRARTILRVNAGLLLSRVAEFIVYVITVILITNSVGVTRFVLAVIAGLITVVLLVNAVLHVVFALPNVFGRMKKSARSLRKGARFDGSDVRGRIVGKGLTQLTVLTDESELLLVPYRALGRV